MIDILSEWVLKSKNHSIDSFFKFTNIRSIALYGLSDFGNEFYQRIKDSVTVSFAIDKNVNSFYNVPVFQIEHTTKNLWEKINAVLCCIKYPSPTLINDVIKISGKPFVLAYDILRITFSKVFLPSYFSEAPAETIFITVPMASELSNLSASEMEIATLRPNTDWYLTNPQYFKEIYSDIPEYDNEYIKAVFSQSPVIQRDGVFFHSDIQSKFVNITQGIRLTSSSFFESDAIQDNRNIHLVGGCNVLGYGVDDKRTIASILQNIITNAPPPPILLLSIMVYGDGIG
jgi:hypothetical protein